MFEILVSPEVLSECPLQKKEQGCEKEQPFLINQLGNRCLFDQNGFGGVALTQMRYE